MSALAGRRVLVVGASRGIGQAIAKACADAGASVALAARSVDKLQVAAKECGTSAIAVACDVCDPSQPEEAVRATVEQFGGLDALVYATGMSIFRPVAELTMEDYQQVFATNAFGASIVTKAALPHLTERAGHAIYLSSESALYEPSPWRGIGAYIASKRALESIVRSFQLENPTVAFTSYVVGATTTEFGSDDPDSRMAEFVPDWYARGYVGADILEPADHGQLVVDILGLPSRMLIDNVGARVRASQ